VNPGSTSRKCRASIPVHNIQKGSGAHPASDQKTSLCGNFCPEEADSEFLPHVGSRLPHFITHRARRSKILTRAAFRTSSHTTKLQLGYRKSSSRIEPEAPGILCRSVDLRCMSQCHSGNNAHFVAKYFSYQPDTAPPSTCPAFRELLPPY
jgi:hypothetical protein